ncbi:histidine phosphatase family protein [Thalassococcus sp. BH17M4-6]|uniref:histidine phosphatase family protein n=1 Tax=Thalassococcus sp. BH17M4-6 TaxID=3413148 RepID=UPI003BBFCCDB
MSHVTMVRHGQANSSARDETGYDRLSPLGHEQARWLGHYLRDTGDVFARVYCGTLRRHMETAAGIDAPCAQAVVRDPRLNELSYFDMARLVEDQHGLPIPTDREGFVHHLPRLFTLWRDGAIDGAPESFAAFEARVSDVLHELAAGRGRALVVTSGGVIAMAMRVAMSLDIPALAHASLAIRNTSLHRFQPLATGLALTQFNATPHLDLPDRHHAQTHI